MFEHNRGAELWKNQLVGTAEQVAEKMRPFLDIAFRHFIVGFPAPYDTESMERLVNEVKPALAGS